MKKLIVILIWVIVSTTMGYSQNIDLTKLPKEKREKLLFEIATEAMKKYAPSYYREDIKPQLVFERVETNRRNKNYGKTIYIVEFPYDLNKAIKENREGENVYGGGVGIVGETGRAYSILPTGWWGEFIIPDESASRGSNTPHPVAEPTQVPANPFKNW
jgi:hypothetical protein